MKIGIDISQLQYGVSGIINYIKSLIDFLQNTEYEVILFKNFRGKTGYGNVKTLYFPFKNFKMRQFWDNIIIGNFARFFHTDLLITPYFSTPPQTGFLKLPVIYDLGMFGKYEKPSETLKYFRYSVNKSIIRSNGIITISRTIKKEIMSRFPQFRKDIIVLYPLLKEISQKTVINNKNLFLYLGTIEERKNPILILEIFEKIFKFNNKALLIFAGAIRSEFKNSFYKKYNKLGKDLKKNIKILGFVSNKEKENLLNKATFLFYLSSYEGFGIPIIEAFQYNVIPIVLKTEISKEVAGDAGVYYNELNISDLFKEKFIEEKLSLANKQLEYYYHTIKEQKKKMLKFLTEITGIKNE